MWGCERFDNYSNIGSYMRLGFFLTQGAGSVGYILADMLISSIRRNIPKTEIYQLTDNKSCLCHGINGSVRLDTKNRLEHYSQLEGEWVLIDSDVLVLDDISDVFDSDFDVAVCDRKGVMLESEVGTDFMLKMPYNLGIIFSRSQNFWIDVLNEWNNLTVNEQTVIYGDQLALNNLIKKNEKYKIEILPGLIYNKSPNNIEEIGSSQHKVIHFKGKRKYWMLNMFLNKTDVAKYGKETLCDYK
jgi:hypothetical protein